MFQLDGPRLGFKQLLKGWLFIVRTTAESPFIFYQNHYWAEENGCV